MSVLVELEPGLSRIANGLEIPRGRSITATFGLQRAHAEGADELGVLLEGVRSAGLNVVDRVIGSFLIVEVIKTRGCRLRHMLAAAAGFLDEHHSGGTERAMALRNLGKEANGPNIESGGVKENDGGGKLFSGFSRNWERNSLARRAVRAARAAFHSHTRSQHAMWSSPRSRARFNPACVRRALASLSTTAMLFFQHGCESCRQTTLVDGVVPRSARRGLGEPRSADSASRISPLSFEGDKRGHEAVAFDQKFLWSDASLRLLADPRANPYLGPNLPLGATASSACPIVADRISMPRKAVVVPLDDWLPPGLVSVWNHPESEASCIPVAPRYFDVNMAEWRTLCRRMLRSGLGKKVHPALSPSHLSGGAFSVPKDLDPDRFIGDRRPRNGTERLIGKCHLPWAPRLRRLTLPSDCVFHIHFRDVSDCYCA